MDKIFTKSVDKSFDEILTTEISTLNYKTLAEIEKYGYRHFSESYINEFGETIQIIIYEFVSKLYLFKYKNSQCVEFLNLTSACSKNFGVNILHRLI